jgi:crotonobetainyl-CoA:carnitine CoA-transferase CaiB-like acyl-CoA transferase
VSGSASPQRGASLLSDLRVLDLTDERVRLAGRAFADLGADVVAVEPDPATTDVRWRVERAGVTVVPLLTDELLAGADVVLSHEARDGRAPQAAWVSVTPYGLTGPRAHWRGSDLTVIASGTGMNTTGDPDRAPLRASEPAAHAHTGGEVVVAALTALASGVVQDVDVSMQELLLVTQMTGPARWPTEHFRGKRRGARTGITTESWRCADGWVSFGLRGGKARVKNLRTFSELAVADGTATEAFLAIDWTTYDPAALSPEDLQAIEDVVAATFAKHTMRELYAHAVSSGLMLAPANNAADIIASEQLAARNTLTSLEGIPAVVRAFTRSEPDRIGLQGEAVLAAAPEWDPRPVPYRFARTDGRAWEGLKILELGSGAAGPIAARYFADHGATVVRIESHTKPDFLRTYSSKQFKQHGVEGSEFFCGLNGGKLDISLNMRDPRAVALAKTLALEWADAVLENFAPGAMAKWGLDFESLRAEKPDLVMASGCLWGNTGPERSYPGFGGQGAALSGWTDLTGWADRAPVGPSGTITDSLAPRYVAASLGAALLHRERTGEGTWIDLSQVEAAIWTLGGWVAEESIGITRDRDGNRHPHKAPHGAFPCADTDDVKDRWVAIAVHSDAEWRTLAHLIGADAALSTPERLQQQDGLELAVSAWTRQRTNTDVAAELQAAGLDAHEVIDHADAHSTPQLLQRKHFVPIEHPLMGVTLYEENGFRLSASGGGISGPGPLIGQHNDLVLLDFLGMAPDEVKELAAEGVLD